MDYSEKCSDDGWSYGQDFTKLEKFSATKGILDMVRRRKWVRTCFVVKEL
jgi:hypothetical protein